MGDKKEKSDESFGLKELPWDEIVLTESFFSAVDSFRRSKGIESDLQHEFDAQIKSTDESRSHFLGNENGGAKVDEQLNTDGYSQQDYANYLQYYYGYDPYYYNQYSQWYPSAYLPQYYGYGMEGHRRDEQHSCSHDPRFNSWQMSPYSHPQCCHHHTQTRSRHCGPHHCGGCHHNTSDRHSTHDTSAASDLFQSSRDLSSDQHPLSHHSSAQQRRPSQIIIESEGQVMSVHDDDANSVHLVGNADGEVSGEEEGEDGKPLYSWGGHVSGAHSVEPIVSPIEDKVRRTRYPTPPSSHHPIPHSHGFAPILVNEGEEEEERAIHQSQSSDSIEIVQSQEDEAHSDIDETPGTPPQFFNNGTPVPYPVTPLKPESAGPYYPTEFLDILPASDIEHSADEVRNAALSVGFPLASIPRGLLEQIGLVTAHAARHISTSQEGHDDQTISERPGSTPEDTSGRATESASVRLATPPAASESQNLPAHGGVSPAERALSLALLAWYSAGYNTGRQQATVQNTNEKVPWWQFWRWFW